MSRWDGVYPTPRAATINSFPTSCGFYSFDHGLPPPPPGFDRGQEREEAEDEEKRKQASKITQACDWECLLHSMPKLLDSERVHVEVAYGADGLQL